MITILLKLFQETEWEGTQPNTLYESSITLIPKLGKDTYTYTHKRELRTNLFNEPGLRNSQ
jgi:hypothetical protein